MSQLLLRCTPFEEESCSLGLEPRIELATFAAKGGQSTLTRDSILDVLFLTSDKRSSLHHCVVDDDGTCSDCDFCKYICQQVGLVRPHETCLCCDALERYWQSRRDDHLSMCLSRTLAGDSAIFEPFLDSFVLERKFMFVVRALELEEDFASATAGAKFYFDSWFPERFQDLGFGDLIDGLKRGPTDEDPAVVLRLLDAFCIEVFTRFENPDVKRDAFHKFGDSRERLVAKLLESRVPRRTLLCRKTAARKHRVKPSVTARVSRPLVRRTQVEIFPDPPLGLQKPLLCDFIFPPEDKLHFGDSFSISSHTELFDLEYAIFGRNKPKYQEMLGSPRLDCHQDWLNQKLLADGNFRRRVTAFGLFQKRSNPRFESHLGLEFEPRGSMDSSTDSGRSYFNGPQVMWMDSPIDDYEVRAREKCMNVYRKAMRRRIASVHEQTCRADVILEKMKSAAAVVDQFAAALTTIRLIMDERSTFKRLQILYLYVRSFEISALVDYCNDFFLDFTEPLGFSSSEGYFEANAGEDLMNEIISFVGVANILALFVGTPMTSVQFLHKRFCDLSRRSDGDDVIKRFWKAFIGFLKTLKLCFDTKSIDPLFASNQTPAEVLAEAEALDVYRNQVVGIQADQVNKQFLRLYDEGKLPSSWTRPFTQDEYMSKVISVRKKLDEVILLVPIPLQSNYRSIRGRLHLIVEGSVGRFASNSMRVQPLGVSLVGPPGTGKSVFTDHIISYIGKRMGFPCDANGRYDLQADVNFQDNADPFKWVMVLDDMDADCKQPTSGVKNHADWIMAVVNNKPLPLESAHVEEKGKNFGRPLLVLNCTNVVDLKVVKFVQAPAAIYRRLPIKLFVNVNPRFAKGGLVDKTAAKGHFNIHDITVQLFDGEKFVHHAVMNDEECLEYLFDRFSENLEEQKAMLSRVDLGICETCPMPVALGQRFCKSHAALGSGTNAHFEGQGTSILSKASATVDDVHEIAKDMRDRRVVAKMDTVMTRMDGMLDSADKALGAPGRAVTSLWDFVQDHSGKLSVVAACLIAAAVSYSANFALQERTDNASDKVPSPWSRLSSVVPHPAADFAQTTWTEADLVTQVRRHIGVFYCGKRWAHCLVVGPTFVLVNVHITWQESEDETYSVELDGTRYSVADIYPLGTADAALVRVNMPKRTNSAFPYFANEIDLATTAYDDVYLVTPSGIIPLGEDRFQEVVNEKYRNFLAPALRSTMDTKSGDCGLPLVARKGPYCRIIGIHHLGYDVHTMVKTIKRASSVLVSKAMMKLKSAEVGFHFQDSKIVDFVAPGPLGPLGPATRSELALAVSKGADVAVLGHDLTCKGRSAGKSKCQRSLYYDDVEPLCRAEFGTPHLWQIPVLRGGMNDDGEWESGYQYIFKHYKETNSHQLLYGPIRDYMTQFDGLDCHGYRTLSWDETIRGLPGSVIGSVNRKTSVGPPGTGPKSNVISAEGEVSPEVREQIDQIETALCAGFIPVVVAACTLKDEPVKAKKNATHNIRVFNCLPMAMNLVSKRYTGPIKAFFRNNPGACEMMVGIDMTSDGGDFIRRRFEMLNPSLDLVVEGDFTKMDKTINGSMAWAVVEVFGRIAKLLGLDDQVVRLVVWSNFEIIYSIHGDLYKVGGMNPSGSDITVEINGVVNSLCHRLAWLNYQGRATLSSDDFQLQVYDCPRFADSNVLVTYGDDWLLAHSSRVCTASLFSIVPAVGMLITDAYDKDAPPQYRKFWECSFLKRGFYLDKETDSVRCGLQIGSIFRMLMIHKPSTLSRLDHNAVVLEEALREIFLNATMDFEKWRSLFHSLASKYGLWASRYCSLLRKEDYEAMYVARTFRTWGLEVELPLVAV